MSSVYEIASKVLVPGAIAEGKILLAKPVGEHLPFTRAGAGSTTIQNGKVVDQAANWPAIVKREGECSMNAWRPASTNAIIHTEDFSAGNWQQVTLTEASNYNKAGLSFTKFTNQTGSTGSVDHLRDLVVNTVAGNTVISVFIDTNETDSSYVTLRFTDGTNDSRVSIALSNHVISTNSNGSIIATGVEELSDTGVIRLWVKRSTLANASSDIFIYASSAGNGSVDTTINKSVSISGVNVVPGNRLTDYIFSDGSSTTRNVDSSTTTGLKASGHIGSDAGAIGGWLKGEVLARDMVGVNLGLGSDNSSGERIYVNRNSAIAKRLVFQIQHNSSVVQTFDTIVDQNKWLFTWDQSPDSNGDRWILSVNGAKVASGPEAFTFPTDTLTMSGASGYWEGLLEIFSQVRLSEAAANAYTTLS